MSNRCATRPDQRARSGRRTVLTASLVIALSSCGLLSEEPPSAAQVVLLDRRDVIARLPEFTATPPGATLVKDQRSTGCEDADWAPSIPSAHREYRIAPSSLQGSVRELRSGWERAGWTLTDNDFAPGEYFAYTKQLGDGWTAGLSVFIFSWRGDPLDSTDPANGISVTGEPLGDSACG